MTIDDASCTIAGGSLRLEPHTDLTTRQSDDDTSPLPSEYGQLLCEWIPCDVNLGGGTDEIGWRRTLLCSLSTRNRCTNGTTNHSSSITQHPSSVTKYASSPTNTRSKQKAGFSGTRSGELLIVQLNQSHESSPPLSLSRLDTNKKHRTNQ